MINNKRIKTGSLFTFFLIAFLVFPQIADAWAFDAAKAALAGLSEMSGPFAGIVMFSIIFALIGVVFIFLSSVLLQGMMEISPQLLTVSGTGDMVVGIGDNVQIAWEFLSGITNMFLLIAFIAIALSIILGVESFGLKKSLPRFVVVALLINFSLLFVEIGIDISNFLWNSVADLYTTLDPQEGGMLEGVGDENIFLRSIYPLIDLGMEIYISSAAFMATMAARLAVPYLNVATQVMWLVAFPSLLAMVVENLVYGGILFMLSGVFFLFYFVLLARIFIIQILAVISPLAFFCLIFDQTKKWFDQWVSYLIQWLLVGVAMLFFMYIGLLFAPIIQNHVRNIGEILFAFNLPWYIDWIVPDFPAIFAYISLFVYFLVILGVIYKLIPAGVQAGMTQVKTMASQYALPMAQAAGKGGRKHYQKVATTYAEKGKEWATDVAEPGSGMQKKAAAFAKRGLGKRITGALEEEQKEIDERAKEIQGKSKETQIATLHNARKDKEKLAAVKAMYKDDRRDEVEEAFLNNEESFNETFKYAQKIGEEKDLKKSAPISYAKHTNADQGEVEKIVTETLKPEDIEKATKKITEAFKSQDSKERKIGEQMIDAILKSRDANRQKSFSKDVKGIESIEERIDQLALSQNYVSDASQINPSIRGQVVQSNYQSFGKHLRRKPGENLYDIEMS